MKSSVRGHLAALFLAHVLMPVTAYYMARPNTCSRPGPADSTAATWHIWIDFDQTLTLNDTIATLGTSTKHWDWEHVVAGYLNDYGAVVAGKPLPRDPLLLDHKLPTTVPTGRWAVNANVTVHDSRKREAIKVIETEIQKSMLAEFRSIERINLAGIFKHMSNDQLEHVGRTEVPLQLGALDTFRALNKLAHVKVCSVNWSKAFIHGALDGAVPVADIVSSDIVADGKIDARVVTGVDKVNLFAAAASAAGALGTRTAFIGDSLHDLLAMLWADVGVLVVPPTTGVPKTSLQRVLDRAGVKIVSLSQFDGVAGSAVEQGPAVYTTSSWAEIRKILGKRL